jgi:hypothetical protein
MAVATVATTAALAPAITPSTTYPKIKKKTDKFKRFVAVILICKKKRERL